jgi:hypothetical protein
MKSGRPFKVFLILLLLLAFPAIPAPSPGTIWPEGIYMTTIPLKRAGRLFILEANIDGVTGNFIFDTGASRLVLNSTYFRNYWTVSGTEAGGMTGSAGTVRRTSVKKLQLSGLTYTNMTADVTDLGHIENRDMEVVIDVARNQLHLYRLDRSGKRIGAASGRFNADLRTKVHTVQNVIFINATIGEKVLNFCLDTGAESNILSSNASKKVMSTVSILRRSDLRGVAGQGSDMLYAAMGDFNLGERKISGMQTLLASMDEMSAYYDYQVDGMLGYDFFEQGEVSLNLITQEMGIIFRKGGNP